METITQLIVMTMNDKNSEEVGELLGRLPADSEQAASKFCDIMGLGDWFYDAMILNDVNVLETLSDIGMQKMLEETEDMAERRERMYELQNQA